MYEYIPNILVRLKLMRFIGLDIFSTKMYRDVTQGDSSQIVF